MLFQWRSLRTFFRVDRASKSMVTLLRTCLLIECVGNFRASLAPIFCTFLIYRLKVHNTEVTTWTQECDTYLFLTGTDTLFPCLCVLGILCLAEGLDEMFRMEVELQKVSWMHDASQVIYCRYVFVSPNCIDPFLRIWPHKHYDQNSLDTCALDYWMLCMLGLCRGGCVNQFTTVIPIAVP